MKQEHPGALAMITIRLLLSGQKVVDAHRSERWGGSFMGVDLETHAMQHASSLEQLVASVLHGGH